MPNDFDDSSSDPPEIARMRRLIAEYESCEDPWLKSEYLDTYGLTRDSIINYRRIVARADLRASTTPSSPASTKGRGRMPRRSRVRRAPATPSSRAYDTTRPGDSRRNRSARHSVIVFIIVRIPRFPDAP